MWLPICFRQCRGSAKEWLHGRRASMLLLAFLAMQGVGGKANANEVLLEKRELMTPAPSRLDLIQQKTTVQEMVSPQVKSEPGSDTRKFDPDSSQKELIQQKIQELTQREQELTQQKTAIQEKVEERAREIQTEFIQHLTTTPQTLRDRTQEEVQQQVQPEPDPGKELTAQEKFQALMNSGLLKDSDSEVELNESMTRAHIAAILAKLIDEGTQPGTFTDVPSSEWAAGFIVAALPRSITGHMPVPDPRGIVDASYMNDLLSKMLGPEYLASADLGSDKMDFSPLFAALLLPGQQGGTNTSTATEILLQNAVENSYLDDLPPVDTGTDPDLDDYPPVDTGSGSNFDDYPHFYAGIVTSVLPANLNATYNGRLSGALVDNTSVTGSITMHVDFSKFGAYPRVAHIPGTIVFDNNKGNASFTLVDFSQIIGNPMTGTYNGEPLLTGSYIKDGRFYGPQANEVAGGWTIETNSASGSGTFNAKR